MKLSIIGGGNMAEAILSAVVGQGVSTPAEIIVADIDEKRLQHLATNYGIDTTSDNLMAAARGEVVVLAVKPQHLAAVMPTFKGRLKPSQLVLSIIAGVSLARLIDGLGHGALVRSMPNTPAQIGYGVTVWTASAETTTAQKGQATTLLGVMGREIYCEDENFLDKATAISGSGPAYVFLFAEALADAAVELGFTPDIALQLVGDTITGAGHLISEAGKTPLELRHAVTSPGGTTEQAVMALEAGNIRALVLQAVTAAYLKARELGES